MLVLVGQIIQVISYFLVWMRKKKRHQQLTFDISRVNSLNPYFVLVVPGARHTHVGISVLVAVKRSYAFSIKTALAIIADIACSCVKKRIAYLLGFLFRHVGHQLFQQPAFGCEDTAVF